MRKPLYEKTEPESVDTGDTIEVVYPKALGIVVKRRGTVAARETLSAGTRVLYTAEGGELYSWHGGYRPGAVFIVARAEKPQETLFEVEPPERLKDVPA